MAKSAQASSRDQFQRYGQQLLAREMDKEERLKGKIPKKSRKEVKGANFVLEQTQDLV